ncbi:MAG: ABC transporter permease [Candidatus Omnitrophica bacterium]|nr:ABC transporter permease [Candidatus Omnitrophota bacterium]
MKPVWALSKLVIKEIFRKKDFYVALILIGVILFYAAQLQFYNVKNIVRYLMEIGLWLVFSFSVILTVTLAARQFPSEIQNRTAAVLLSKPIRRGRFVIGKFLGSFLAGASAFLIFYVLFLAVASAKGGGLASGTAVQTAYLFLLNLMVVAAMASGFSYYLTVSANVSVTLILYLLMGAYGQTLKGRAWAALYYCLPHFEFFDLRQRFIHEWGPISAGLVFFLTCYAAVYTAIFLLLGALKLQRHSL